MVLQALSQLQELQWVVHEPVTQITLTSSFSSHRQISLHNKNKIIGNMGKFFMSEECNKLAAMCIIRYPRSNSHFQNVGNPFCRQIR